MPRCALPPLKLLTIAILAVLPVLSAYAGPQTAPPQRDDSQQDSRKPRDNSLSDAVRQVERNTRGEVLSAERVQYDGRDMHRVKVVDDAGRVRVFMQDPKRADDGGASSQSPPPRQRPTRSKDD